MKRLLLNHGMEPETGILLLLVLWIAVVAAFSIPSVWRRFFSPERLKHAAFGLLELGIVAIALGIWGYTLPERTPGLKATPPFNIEFVSIANPRPVSVIETLLVSCIFLMPVVLVIRYVRARNPAIVLAPLWSLALIGWAFYLKSWPVYQEISLQSLYLQLFDPILVPSEACYLRFAILAVVPVLAGMILCRKGFGNFKYLSIVFGTTILTYVILHPFTPGSLFHTVLIRPAGTTLLAFVLVILPIQRAAMERFMGIALHPEAPPPAQRRLNVAMRVWLTALVILCAVIIGASPFVNYWERRQMAALIEGVHPHRRSPAEKNAYDILTARFHRQGSPKLPEINNRVREYELYSAMDPGAFETLSSATVRTDVKGAADIFSPYLEDMMRAAESDYYQADGPTILSFLNLRETSRMLAAAAMVQLYEGETTAALSGIRANLVFPALLQMEGPLVQTMIAASIRGVGVDGTYNVWQCVRTSRDGLMKLTEMMDDIARQVRLPFPVAVLRQCEIGMFPVVPNMAVAVPALMRAYTNYYMKWSDFDRVRIACALELYRLDRGGYPDHLAELVPSYIDKVPLDPYEGSAYIYKNLGKEFHLESPYLEKIGAPFVSEIAFHAAGRKRAERKK